MRTFTAGLVAALLLAPTAGMAQGRLALRVVRLAPAPPAARAVPIVRVAPVTIGDEDSSEPVERTAERLAERLRPIEQRLRGDDRLRRAGTVAGLGAIALGALRGTAPLTAVGTHALRFGLHSQLAAIETRSGFVVEPSIGRRSIAVTVRRTLQ